MLKLAWSTEAVEALRYWRFHHPHPLVQLKMEVVLLRSQGVSNEQIQHICGISKATLYRYLHEYREGGVERLKALHFTRQESALGHQRTTLEAHFRAQPPATVAAAAAQIEALTGIKRGLTQTRQFLQKLGMQPRKLGQIPAKADPEAQEAFKAEKLEPRLAEAQAGQRMVFFMDAAHFVYAPFLAWVWCFTRVFVQAPSGRQRLNVLAALHATTKEIVTVQNLTYVTAETVCELLRLLAGPILPCRARSCSTMRAIKSAPWCRNWRGAWAWSCYICLRTRPISISLSACGNGSRSNVSTGSIIQRAPTFRRLSSNALRTRTATTWLSWRVY